MTVLDDEDDVAFNRSLICGSSNETSGGGSERGSVTTGAGWLERYCLR